MTFKPELYAYVQCRDIGHRWSDGGSKVWKVSRGIVGRVVRCDNCGAERMDIRSTTTGEAIRRDYTYPVGYLTTGSGYKRRDFTVEALKRAKRTNVPKSLKRRVDAISERLEGK